MLMQLIEIYERFRDQCMHGRLCWQDQPLPYNVLTGRPFSGLNAVLLAQAAPDCSAWIDHAGAVKQKLDVTQMQQECIISFTAQDQMLQISSYAVYNLRGTALQAEMPEEPWRCYELLESLQVPFKTAEIFTPQVRYAEKLLLMPQDRGSVEASADAYNAALWMLSQEQSCLSVPAMMAIDLAAAKLCFYFGQRYQHFVDKALICEYVRQIEDAEQGIKILLDCCALSERICSKLFKLQAA